MAFFPRATGVARDGELALRVKLSEQPAPIFEQRFPKTQLDSFAVAHTVARQVLASQPQEGFGFLELLVGDFRWLEFFLLSESCDSKRVMASLRVTYSSARLWNRR